MTPNQDKRGVRPTAKNEKRFDKKSLGEIISSALSELSSQSKEASMYLISLANNGSLEKHQTKGNVAEMAKELLQKLRGENHSAN